MKMVILMIFFALSLCANSIENEKEVKVLCFKSVDRNESLACQAFKHKVVLLPQNINITDSIAFMQKTIRHETANKTKVVLLAQGFTGTLLAIAQTNLLAYFRQNIIGIALENSPVNLFKTCSSKSAESNSSLCQEIVTFRKELGSLASKTETFIALSPALQMDWYWSKTLIIGRQYKEEWIKALNENAITYETEDVLKGANVLDYFSLKSSQKIQPEDREIEPRHNGTVLRFHLNKIYYASKHKLIEKKDLSYGEDFLQSYDLYFKEKSKNNPLMIYVHGGGWTQGDKESYEHLCKQYADRGFTAVSLNYRLLEYPRVSMEEMVTDVKVGIEHILNNAQAYEANASKVLVMAESAGGQLASIAISRLAKERVSVAVFNSISADFHLFPKAKQIRLSNIKDDKKRAKWLDDYSPVNQLDKYAVPTLVAHSFSDHGVPAKHLENFELLSALHDNNVVSLWVEGGMHPIVPKKRSLQPSYMDIENEGMRFVNKYLD